MKQRKRRTSRAHWADLYERFRSRLILAREEAGLTQRQAALRLRRNQSYIAKSESGERRVDVVELREFARAYDKPVDFFIP